MGEIKKQVISAAICGVIGAIGATTAFVFFALAIYFGLSTSMSPAAAAALTGLIMLAATAIVIGAVRAIMDEEPRPTPKQQQARSTRGPASAAAGSAPDLTELASQFGAMFGEQASDFAKRHTGATLIGSLALGFVLGVSPSLREAIRKALFR